MTPPPIATPPPPWTRSFLAERFPYPVTPLAWGFVSEELDASLRQAFELLDEPSHGEDPSPLVASFGGYVYGRSKVIAQLTTSALTRVEGREDSGEPAAALVAGCQEVQSLAEDWRMELGRYLLELEELRRVEVEALDDEALWQHLTRLGTLGRRRLPSQLALAIVHDGLLRAFLGLAPRLGDRPAALALYDELTARCEPHRDQVTRELWQLQRLAAAEPELVSTLLTGSRRDIWQSSALERFPGFHSAFSRFLKSHGHLGGVADPYRPAWAAEPWLALETLHLMLGQSAPGAEATQLEEGERSLEQNGLNVGHDLGPGFSQLCRLMRSYKSLEDLGRYEVARGPALFRTAACELGRRFVAGELLGRPDHIFFLRREEVEGVLEGRLAGARAGALGEAARRDYEDQSEASPPQHHDIEAPPPAEYADTLTGLGGSSGKVEGQVSRVFEVEDFSGFPPGAVLVARTTDLSWRPLLESACAVITECGGPFSHAAAAARELGVPMVTAGGALGQLGDGEEVEVDGDAGTVTRL